MLFIPAAMAMLSFAATVFADRGHTSGNRKGHGHARAGGAGAAHQRADNVPTQDFVAPEYFKCLNQVNGAFYFYDTSMLREYALGKVGVSPLRASKDKCEFLAPLNKSYKVYDVTLQPDIGKMTIAIGTNPITRKQQIVACNAISWDFSKASDGILCTAELAKDVNNPKTQAFIGNINDSHFNSG